MQMKMHIDAEKATGSDVRKYTMQMNEIISDIESNIAGEEIDKTKLKTNAGNIANLLNRMSELMCDDDEIQRQIQTFRSIFMDVDPEIQNMFKYKLLQLENTRRIVKNNRV